MTQPMTAALRSLIDKVGAPRLQMAQRKLEEMRMVVVPELVREAADGANRKQRRAELGSAASKKGMNMKRYQSHKIVHAEKIAHVVAIPPRDEAPEG